MAQACNKRVQKLFGQFIDETGNDRGNRRMKNLDNFTLAYIVCALWSSCDDNGEPLDSNYSIDDIEPESLELIIEECKEFQFSWANTLNEYCELYQHSEYTGMSLAGHDYWLTRNGHGVGFWDRGIGEVGDILTKACQYQERHLFVNDSGKLDYVMG